MLSTPHLSNWLKVIILLLLISTINELDICYGISFYQMCQKIRKNPDFSAIGFVLVQF